MNQIIPVGNGILIGTDQQVPAATYQAMAERWRSVFPDIPMLLIYGQIKTLPDSEISVFEFTGEVTPTVVAEFQRWWEEVHRG